MRLADYLWQRVAATGVRHVFMLPGGGAMHLVDALGRNPDLACICNLHEQGTAVAVDAYAQVRGFGAGLVTTGPGGTNALTGVAGAWLDSTPLLMVSGQVKRADLSRGRGVRQFGFQELDIAAMARPITKEALTLTEPESVRYHLDRLLHLARAGRPGPVWLDVPLDVQATEIDPEALPGYTPEPPPPQDLAAVAEQALTALDRAERPVVLVGNGVRLAGATRTCLELIERLGIPVLTTWKAADLLPEDHPLFAGRPGASGQRAANFTQQNSDWILVLGARLDLGQLAYMHEHFARAAFKAIVDVDPAELSKLRMEVQLPVAADARDFLEALLDRLPSHPQPQRRPWLERVQAWRRDYPVLRQEYWEEQGHVNAYALVEALSGLLGEGDLLVPGSSGQCSELTFQAWQVAPGLRMLNSQGLGPMGFGVPAALGACVASGGRRTVCLDGDGGFHMNLQELEVIRRLGLPVKFFVFDNQGYGSIRGMQRAHFGGHLVACDASSGLTLPDTLAVARAYGMQTATLDTMEGLREQLETLLAAPGPLVCNVRLHPDQATLPRAVSYRRPDGSMTTRPMEDLFPLLDRTEFAANLLIPPVEP